MQDSTQLLINELKELTDHFPNDQKKIIFLALDCAHQAHKDQRRKSGEHYITHPLSVAVFLTRWGLDYSTIAAALLHDVIEDTTVTDADLLETFGAEIVALVQGMSKIQHLKFENKELKQANNFRKMLLAITDDYRIILIKMADRLHNMQTIEYMSLRKQKEIALETLEIYALIARRLGLQEIFETMSEQSFQILHPLRFSILSAHIQKKTGSSDPFINSIKSQIQEDLVKNNIPDHQITFRKKTIYSVYQKMRVRGVRFEQIKDLSGVCVVVKDVNKCYLALGIIHRRYKPISGYFKDYIAIPKSNAYQSLHTLVLTNHNLMLEVQIRSTSMQETAQRGIAAHWAYKESSAKDSQNAVADLWVAQISEINNHSDSSIDFLNHFKQLFQSEQSDKVYAFTPQQTVIELIQGATCIDFAYAIHTDIGNHAVYAVVDNQKKPLNTLVENGQTLEIFTKLNCWPKVQWLAYAMSVKAQMSITRYLRHTQGTRHLDTARHVFLELLWSNTQKTIEQIPRQYIEKLLKHHKLQKMDDVYKSIATGKLMPLGVIHFLSKSFTVSYQEKTSTLKNLIKRTMRHGERHQKIINNIIELSECCYPIQNDRIVGELTENNKVLIHRTNCLNYSKFQNQQARNFFSISWADFFINTFETAIHIQFSDQSSQTIFKIFEAIGREKIQICGLNMKPKPENHTFQTFRIVFKIKTRLQLKNIIVRLKEIHHVERIYR